MATARTDSYPAYQTYNQVIDNGKRRKGMTLKEKSQLIKQIDQLETEDHIGILRIIMTETSKKIYTVNNYGTYFDLNDLDNQTLWKISYHVNLCLENQEREVNRKEAEREHLQNRINFEESIKRQKNGKRTQSIPTEDESDSEETNTLETHIGTKSEAVRAPPTETDDEEISD